MRADDLFDVAADDARARAVARELARALTERRVNVLGENRRASSEKATTATTASATTARTTASPSARRDLDAARERIDALERALVEGRRALGEAARAGARAATRRARQEAEIARLRACASASRRDGGARGARVSTRVVEPAATRGDGAPETVGVDYHRAAIEAFERKVDALADEIERLRRERAALTAALEASEHRGRIGARTPEAGSPRGGGDDDAREARSPPGADAETPFSPSTSPLDALLARMRTERDHASP